MNSKKFWFNGAVFLGLVFMFAILDFISGKNIGPVTATISAFFIVWNMNACEEEKPSK